MYINYLGNGLGVTMSKTAVAPIDPRISDIITPVYIGPAVPMPSRQIVPQLPSGRCSPGSARDPNRYCDPMACPCEIQGEALGLRLLHADQGRANFLDKTSAKLAYFINNFFPGEISKGCGLQYPADSPKCNPGFYPAKFLIIATSLMATYLLIKKLRGKKL